MIHSKSAGKRFALIGEKLIHSFSKEIHQALGLDYDLVSISREDIQAFFDEGKYDGVNITIPYKTDVIPFCESLSSEARMIGAVNTMLRGNNTKNYTGFNTDLFGFKKMAERAGIAFEGRHVVIFGSGGTSKTAQIAAAQGGARRVTVVSRTGSISYDDISSYNDAEILINTTPVGMYPNGEGLIIEPSLFSCCGGVLDVIYNPLETQLLRRARELELKRANGLFMLVCQGIKSAEIWGETAFSDEKAEEIHSMLLKTMRNIVLVGMPGCGKSTAGRVLAHLTGFQFADIDTEIEKTTGKSPSEIITGSGEEHFREIESEAVKHVCAGHRQIVATGGGSVLRKSNRNAMKSNGIVVFLNCPVSQLQTKGRPLSQGGNLEDMQKRREPLYRNLADVSIEVQKTPEETANAIVNAIENLINMSFF